MHGSYQNKQSTATSKRDTSPGRKSPLLATLPKGAHNLDAVLLATDLQLDDLAGSLGPRNSPFDTLTFDSLATNSAPKVKRRSSDQTKNLLRAEMQGAQMRGSINPQLHKTGMIRRATLTFQEIQAAMGTVRAMKRSVAKSLGVKPTPAKTAWLSDPANAFLMGCCALAVGIASADYVQHVAIPYLGKLISG